MFRASSIAPSFAIKTTRIIPFALAAVLASENCASLVGGFNFHQPTAAAALRTTATCRSLGHHTPFLFIAPKQQSKMASTTSGGTHDEVAAAVKAEKKSEDQPTAFDKILSGEWSCNKVYEDELCLAFHDLHPQGPVHVIVIPKNRDGLTRLSNAREDQKDILGHLMYVAATEVGHKMCPNGFRIVINDGKHGSQSVYHLHLHVIGGRQMGWPPG